MELNIDLKKSIIISFFMLLSFAQATPGILQIQTQPPLASAPATSYPELKKICDTTDYASLCLNGKNDPISVLEMAINVTIQQTNLTISTAAKIANTSDTPADTASALGDCQQNYQDGLDNLHSAQAAILEKDIGTINSMLSAALTDYVTCNDGFSGSNPVVDYNNKLRNMTSNCLAIASLIK